jgi:hypothetical protein
MQITNSRPVTLVYHWQNELQTEPHQNTEAAIARASELVDDPNVADMFIAEERAEPPRVVVLNPSQLRAECAGYKVV